MNEKIPAHKKRVLVVVGRNKSLLHKSKVLCIADILCHFIIRVITLNCIKIMKMYFPDHIEPLYLNTDSTIENTSSGILTPQPCFSQNIVVILDHIDPLFQFILPAALSKLTVYFTVN